MPISHIAIVPVPVSDQGRAKAFYVETLGFTLIADNPTGPDQRWVEVGPAGGQTTLTLVTWFPTIPQPSLTTLFVDTQDIEATYGELAGRGVVFDGPIESPQGERFAVFHDPDGNIIVLQEAMAH